MNGARRSGGPEVRLRPRGVGQFLDSGFLIVWLCAWVVGEALALWILVAGVTKLLEGEPVEPLPTIGIVLFLLVWLSFWTIGGVAAIQELLRRLWAEDRLTAEPPGLHIVRRLGPFRSGKELRRDEIRRIRLLPVGKALVAETVHGTVELSTLGTLVDRQDAARSLTACLGIVERDPSGPPDTLPEGWSPVIDPEGGMALVPDPAIRRKQMIFTTVVATIVGVGALLAVREALASPNLSAPALLAVAAAAGLGWGTLWLARGRMEWSIGHGRLYLRRRFGARARIVFEAAALELDVSEDSDGDEGYQLDGIAPPHPHPPVRSPRRRTRRRIARAIHDPDVPSRLGRWLSARAGIPFRDRTTEEERDAAPVESGPAGR